jgi:hypothetical protein
VNCLRRWILGGALGLALLSSLLAAPSALGDAQTRRLELNVISLQFTSFTCLNNSCSLARVTDAGAATSNLGTGRGSFTGTLIVDFSPGGSCNIVDESDTFSFAKGTISVHSNHEDCATHGLRRGCQRPTVGRQAGPVTRVVLPAFRDKSVRAGRRRTALRR